MKARDVAVAVLADSRAGRRTAKRSLDELIGRYRIVPADVGLANELVSGVMRHRLTLEAVLRPATDGRWDRVSSTLQHILLVAAYQLMWLDAVPAFAAVNEAVEQAKREGGRRAAGFVNAVLRFVQRHLVARDEREPARNPRCCVPIGPNRYCRFDLPALPDPVAEPAGFLAAATSHPEVLVNRWIRAFGREQAEAVCIAGTRRPPLVLRPNLLRTDAAKLAERLKAEGCDAQVVPLGGAGSSPRLDKGGLGGVEAGVVNDPARAPCADRGAGEVAPRASDRAGHAVVVVLSASPSPGPVSNLAAFREGLFQPQDITAMQPVRASAIEAGSTVVDLCAGYGTKATQAAEQMGDRGLVIASDTVPDKLAALAENCRRLGITCVRTVAPQELAAVVASQKRLDVILVDVPCSNTGVLARRPEARYRFALPGLRPLTATQAELLRRGAELARPETRLCYSTCSVEREENEDIVQAFRRAHTEWRVLQSRLTLPQCGPRLGDWRDGGFYAVLVRESRRGS
jgi:16S rRNA (cytosine967-C5)-methyltransferase